ncbi:hypothetical protein HY988_05630 [Candidatus Micrarchaeota archaeon]|nr:hypothetical protein [Candidatus Micrarchaeota archaeon]
MRAKLVSTLERVSSVAEAAGILEVEPSTIYNNTRRLGIKPSDYVGKKFRTAQ